MKAATKRSNYVFEIVGALICLFSLTIVLFRFLGFGNHNKNRRRGDFVDERCGRLEHADLNIDAGCFFNVSTFLVKLGSFRPTFDALTNARNFNNQVFVVEFICDLHTAVHVSHLDCRTSDTCIALRVVLLQINFIV